MSQPTGQAVPLEELINQIKSDIGQYNKYAADHAADAPLNNACGGKIDLTIKAVTVTVTTVAKSSEGATAGAEVSPVAFLKLSAGGGLSSAQENSQVLNFTLVPASPAASVTSENAPRPSQLLAVLTNLRESLLRSSAATPCLRFPEKDQENSVEFGFTATKSSTTSVGVNLWIFAVGYNRGSERTAAHTVKIAFEGAGQAIQ